ncbi:MAG: DUF2891 domain-containing protein [Weeksellaceae bacterium]|nr:DUF2891 domain-containing protein [Weeksellaceae bacterium]
MNFKQILFGLLTLSILSCTEKKTVPGSLPENTEPQEISTTPAKVPDSAVKLDSIQAERLARLPFQCIQNQYPNKTGQVLSDSTDLGTPKELHPAFYGCFDWHSSVHGHWSLVKLIKDFPKLQIRDSIITQLKENINSKNIQQEINYFKREQEYAYERMYGWSWLLKLQSELNSWDDEDGRRLASELEPLSELIVSRYLEFLPKLNYPLRVGMHGNSAFGMSFAYDYAVQIGNEELKTLIESTARRLYLKDKNCPIEWEPNGFDFFSPCLQEVDLMQRILARDEFNFRIVDFLPQLKNTKFNLNPAEVSDRKDGHLVHLDGLNFSRAWVMYRLAKSMPNEFGHLKAVADRHLAYSLPVITDGSYEGEHWLASFALYALSER